MKQIRQTTWMSMLMRIASVIGMLAFHACGTPIFEGSANISPPFYIDIVEGDGVYNSIVLKHDGDEDYEDIEAIDEFSETNTPAVSWIYKKGSRPKYFFVLVYKRGISNKVYYMHLVDGSKTNKKKGVADYVNISESLANTEKYPVEYRTIVMEIIKGDWTINDDGDITIKDEGISTTFTLNHSDIVSLVRYKESHYIERTEYKDMSKGALEQALSDDAKSIQHFVGEAVGIPLIRMGSAFTVESSGLHNGQFIQESDRTVAHIAAPCVGYLGKSVSPHLKWEGGNPDSKYVVLAYMPMQRAPTEGVRNISQSIASPYFAIWFQYNTTATTLERGDASDGENYETHKVTYKEKGKGKLTQNVYSQAYNELNSVHNTCNSEDSNIFVTRVRYDGPVSAPTTGRQYTRFVVFEVNDEMEVYYSDEQGYIQDNRDEPKETLSNGEAVLGSAVDKLVRNFIDYDREKVRTNSVDIGRDTVEHKNGEVTIRGVAVLTFPMNAPSAP